jgi:transcriptional regulator with XRE-family HTH domain
MADLAPPQDGPFDPIDIHVGAEIRRRRKFLSMSQSGLAEQLGITFQQIQKYERGANRVSASALYRIAITLKTTPGAFFEGLGELPREDSAYLAREASIKRAGMLMPSLAKIADLPIEHRQALSRVIDAMVH